MACAEIPAQMIDNAATVESGSFHDVPPVTHYRIAVPIVQGGVASQTFTSGQCSPH